MIHIASNIDYKAPYYLDARQFVEVPEGKTYYQVLSEWDIPIPDGFEVFCDGYWWTYGVNNEMALTGKFRRRTSGGGGSDSNFTLTLTHPSGSERMIDHGTTQNVTVQWLCKYYGEEVKPDSVVIKVNNGENIYVTDLNYNNYVLHDISGGDKIVVTASYGGETKTASVQMLDVYLKYYGGCVYDVIEPWMVTSQLDEIKGTGAALQPMTFDCTGGKYAYYVFPRSLYIPIANTLKVFVGGWETSDYIIQEGLTINNEEYVALRLGYIQTGQLNIEVKER